MNENDRAASGRWRAHHEGRNLLTSAAPWSRPWLSVAAVALALALPVACGPASPAAAEGEGSVATSVSIATPPRVEADGETLEGDYFGSDASQAVFKGIPYALPPIGELRWRPPQLREPREGLQSATTFPPACPQTDGNLSWYRSQATALGQDPSVVFGMPPVSEDCLYVNVWTTNWQGDTPQPVMVWIYGGGNTVGWSTEPPYLGHRLARRGVVVVSLNYRVNNFGFMAHPGLTAESENDASGNYGLLDQIAALEWVQRNIAQFGGDPDRVTVFGESAGGANVAFLLASPLSEGLFHRAISQSGGYPVRSFYDLEQAEERGRQLGKVLGGAAASEDPAASLAAMRAASIEEILEARLPRGSGGGGPNVDGWVVPRSLAETFASGEQHAIPLLIGFNANEGAMGAQRELDAQRVEQTIRDTYGSLADRAMEIYPVDGDEELADVLDRYSTNTTFGCSSKYITAATPQTGANAWLYFFTRVQPAGKLGAYHGAEIPYVFNTPDSWMPWDTTDAALADAVGGYWTQFAATGDPNRDGLPQWPAWEESTDAYMELGDRVRAGEELRQDACALYNEALAMWAQE